VIALSFGLVIRSSSIWFKQQIAIDDETNRKPWPDCQRRLTIKIASDNLLPSLIQGISAPGRKAVIIVVLLSLRSVPEFTSVPTDSSVDSAAAPSSSFQWLSTSSSAPDIRLHPLPVVAPTRSSRHSAGSDVFRRRGCGIVRK